jgi:hypothetical protein
LVLAGYANVLPNNGTLDQLIATYPDNPEIGYLIPAMALHRPVCKIKEKYSLQD